MNQINKNWSILDKGLKPHQFDGLNNTEKITESRLLLLFVSIGRYLRIREQQKIISQETQRQEEEIRLQKKQLQHQHLEEQHHRQASEYQFESNEIDGTASQQQVSTPIQSSQIRAGYFDRENPFRKSDRVGENLQKPTPADKTRYFQEKQTTELRSGKQLWVTRWRCFTRPSRRRRQRKRILFTRRELELSSFKVKRG